MYSEALLIMDRNTTQLMIEDMQTTIEQLKELSAQKDDIIAQKDDTIAALQAEIDRLSKSNK